MTRPTTRKTTHPTAGLGFQGRDRGTSDSLTQYLHEITRYPVLSRDEEADVGRRARAGDPAALETLVEANLRFVVSEAKRYYHCGVPRSDLVNEGNVGLLRAARSFDPGRGVRFISYAAWYVRRAVLQAVTEQSRIVHVPAGRLDALRKLDREGADATSAPLAGLGADVERAALAEVRAARAPHLSLDAALAEEGDVTLGEVLADAHEPPPDATLCAEELRRLVDAALAELGERDARVLRLHFGLDGGGARTAEEIGALLGLAPERVRQHRDRALERLRRGRRAAALAGYAA